MARHRNDRNSQDKREEALKENSHNLHSVELEYLGLQSKKENYLLQNVTDSLRTIEV